MENSSDVSRRHFLQAAGTLSGAACLRLTAASVVAISQAACSAREQSAAFRVLGPDEAADLAAIAARIIPATGTPGASEAGVIHFLDNAFADAMSDSLPAARAGLADFNAALGDSNSRRFHQMTEDAQDRFLATQQDSGFFGLIRTMTIFGFFAMESYGGNRDHLSWDLIGFEGHRGGWSYPFGYYDAEYAKEPGHGE